ncbi:hypothetical protein FN846DRAFT_952429 [Sphaerosporella brunnea]|uniref:PCI domain-containing protein n=1 Tax=Sphaerosporella brunnea TaxID=1250544 RepID=A0A5J5EVI8_9PEZI|nr:hypothetical protein FN846DRAFT_952429 [Sphaerosporella brunnea]
MADQKYLTALQPFILLAKSATGRAAADLVVQATQASGCFVFSELLECPNIQALSASPDGNKYLELLKIFAYGSLSDYRANEANLPPLSEKQLEKLKQLSLITLASRGAEYLTYPSLLQSLELPSVRLLEDLVISAIYAGLLHAKLDTASQLVEVSSTAGRDVAPSEIADIIATLNAWSQQCEDVLADIDDQMKTVHREAVQKKKEAEEYERLLTAKKGELGIFKGGGKGKRVISESAEDGRYLADDDDMDIDDGSFGEAGGAGWPSNAGRRRIKNRLGGVLGNKRR